MSETSSKRFAALIPGLVLFGICVAAYSIPAVVNYLRTDPFVYTNASDEITYLSFQGAGVQKFRPGYWFSSWIVLILHGAGLSGAAQNVLFDSVIPFLMWLSVAEVLKRLGVSRVAAYILSVIAIFFGPAVNFSNQLLAESAWLNSDWIVAPQHNFLPLLRTPQPQLSWLLISLTAVAVARGRSPRSFWLVVPLLYWTTGAWCVFGLFAYEVSRLPRIKRSIVAILSLTAVLYVGFVSLGFRIVAARWPVWRENVVYAEDVPRLSFVAVCIGVSWAILEIVGLLRRRQLLRAERMVFASATAGALIISNLNLLAGARLDLRSLEGYEGTLLVGIAVTWLVKTVTDSLCNAPALSRPVLAYVLLWVTALGMVLRPVLSGSGFDHQAGHYAIVGTYDFGQDREWLLEHPLQSVVPDTMWRSSRSTVNRLTLARPRQIAPLFSYQYGFARWMRRCGVYEMHADAHEEVIGSKDFKSLPKRNKKSFKTSWERFEEVRNAVNPEPCRPSDPGEPRLIRYSDDDFWITFP